MDIELLGATVNLTLFIIGIVFGAISFIAMVVIRPNSAGVFQYGHGMKRFVPDSFVVGEFITLITSCLTFAGSFGAIWLLLGLGVWVGIILLLCLFSRAYRRVTKKMFVSPCKKLDEIKKGE